MKCRMGCGACCIAISISSPIPGMAEGKKAGIRCINLQDDYTCSIYHCDDYPKVCRELRATIDICGSNRDQAFQLLQEMERLTDPG